MKTKIYNLKFDDAKGDGTFKAVFSTLNVKDKDKDITRPGAFGSQEVIIAGYNHASWQTGVGALPVGKGRIYEVGLEAIVEGKFFLDTTAGMETYKTVKNVGALQEWSYSLPDIDYEYIQDNGEAVRVLKKIRVNEVSPVLMGAGTNTRLLEIKTATKNTCPVHKTGTNQEEWDAQANAKRIKKAAEKTYFVQVYGWSYPGEDDTQAKAYKFLHHLIASDGTPGDASIKACIAGIAALNGARGGATIPDADRPGVWEHLAQHLRDAGVEPAELKALDYAGNRIPLLDRVEVLITDVAEVVERLEDIESIREEKGRKFSEPTLKRAAMLKSVLSELVRRFDGIQERQQSAVGELMKYYQIKMQGVK